MTNEPLIGIDLGTSTTVVCVYRDGKPVPIPDPERKTPLIPSVVALRRGNLETGHRAEWQEPQIREAKREMGSDKVYELGDRKMRPQDVAAEVLRKAKANAELNLGVPVRRVVVTVPALFTDLERRATSEAVHLAGLEEIRIINEPTAAALAYGLQNPEQEGTLLVFDWGGGTLDVTVLEMLEGVLDVKTSTGDKYLGGKDVDAELVEWAKASFAREHPGALVGLGGEASLRRACKEAKEALSSTPGTEIVVENYASAGGAEVDLEVTVTRDGFEALIAPLVERAMATVDAALAKGGLRSSEITDILPVGGTTWIPAVGRALASHLPGARLLKGTVDPDLAVASGAAVSAALAGGKATAMPMPSVVIQDVCNTSLGIDVIQDVDGVPTLMYDELIPANTPIPYFVKNDSYRLMRPDQSELEIALFEDPSGRARHIEDAIPTSVAGVITDIPMNPYGEPHRLEIEFRYDQNQMASLTAKVRGTGKELTLRMNRGGTGGLRNLPVMAPPSSEDWKSAPLAERNRAIIARAEEALKGGPVRGEVIEAVLADLQGAIARGDDGAVGASRARLIDLLSEL